MGHYASEMSRPKSADLVVAEKLATQVRSLPLHLFNVEDLPFLIRLMKPLDKPPIWDINRFLERHPDIADRFGYVRNYYREEDGE